MFYVVTAVGILVAVWYGVHMTLKCDKKLEKDGEKD
jgi:hypothetical protein